MTKDHNNSKIMEKLAYSIIVVVSIVAVSGKPRSRSENRYVTDTWTTERPRTSSEFRHFTDFYTQTARSSSVHEVYPTGIPDGHQENCYAAIRRERCTGIFIDAISGTKQKDLRASLEYFEYYCRKIPEFVTCLQESKNDFMVLLECEDVIRVGLNRLMTAANISREELWDLSINLFETANDIVCSRTEEFVNLIECLEKRDLAWTPGLPTCFEEYTIPLADVFTPFSSGGTLDHSELCGSTVGLGGCVRDLWLAACEDSTDLLNTIYDDVIVGVLGNGLGCESSSNPIDLLAYVRAVRDKLKR